LAVLANNQGAIQLYQANGFIVEGHRTKFVKFPTGFVDDILMVKFIKYDSPTNIR
jgi:RimJ/RimL family protein N-acetyltransferase